MIKRARNRELSGRDNAGGEGGGGTTGPDRIQVLSAGTSSRMALM